MQLAKTIRLQVRSLMSPAKGLGSLCAILSLPYDLS